VALSTVYKTEQEYGRYLGSIESALTLSSQYDRTRPMAFNSQRDYNSLKGLQSWSPVEIGESKISLTSLGLTLQTCQEVTYEVSGSMTTITTSGRSDRAQTSTGVHRKYSGLLAGFLERSVNRINASGIGEWKATFGTANVGQHLQSLSCYFGRLDIVAAELQGIVDRYNAKIVGDKSDSLSLSMEFEGRNSMLRVDFKIGPAYPWLPVDVELDVFEGSIDVDVDRIRRALRKNTKLGFGSLSRACDILSAFVS